MHSHAGLPSRTDTVDVHRLLVDYAYYSDVRDAESWSALFGDAGVLVAFGLEFTGAERLSRFCLRAPVGVHVLSVPHITREDAGAFIVRSSFIFQNAETNQTMAGWYFDRIVASGEGLMFDRREIDLRAGGPAAPTR